MAETLPKISEFKTSSVGELTFDEDDISGDNTTFVLFKDSSEKKLNLVVTDYLTVAIVDPNATIPITSEYKFCIRPNILSVYKNEHDTFEKYLAVYKEVVVFANTKTPYVIFIPSEMDDETEQIYAETAIWIAEAHKQNNAFAPVNYYTKLLADPSFPSTVKHYVATIDDYSNWADRSKRLMIGDNEVKTEYYKDESGYLNHLYNSMIYPNPASITTASVSALIRFYESNPTPFAILVILNALRHNVFDAISAPQILTDAIFDIFEE